MRLWETEGARRRELDQIKVELNAHRRVAKRGNAADYAKETVLLDRLEAARIAWEAAYEDADKD